ncbi:MAG: DNA polymerase I [Clostridia bacterium]|nr:DNA polymerase I [Clostridia bacterium]
MKLLAIDGNSLINRAFYGIKLLSTKDGKYTNAVYGFINILFKLMENEQPDGVAVAFDIKKPTFRHLKYEAYKAGRHAMPDELREQFPLVKEWLQLAGYHCIECEGFEADDILGTLAAAAVKSGNECVVATGDRDSLQLVSENTRVLLAATRMGQTEVINYTPEKVFERYSITPKEMIELKALMGDSSDNIPGVAGVGEKTATDLISRYHSIDYIYENIDSLEIKEGIRNKLKDGKDSAYLSRWLGTINLEAPIDADFEKYRKNQVDEDKLSAFMVELELFKLIERMNLKPVSVKAEKKEAQAKKVAVCEYNGQMPRIADIYIEGDTGAMVSEGKAFALSRDELCALLSSKETKKRVYGYKELCKRFENIENVTFDTLLAGYLCNPSSNDYSLERLAAEYSVIIPETEGDANDLIKSAITLSAVNDALYELLSKNDEIKLLEEIEVPLAKVLANMETEGFLADCEGLKAKGEELAQRIAEIEKEIFNLAGTEFNVNSPKQLGEILFVKLGLPAKKKTKSGYSTNADVLESLRYDFPIVELILEYRQLAKLKSTYCDGLLSAVAEDGRIHSTFNQTEARTGRISSLEPNLQNIPVRTEEGRQLRKFFIAKEGFVLCDADYSQIELRVLASIAEDKAMIEAFNSGIDIHTLTASEVFDIPVDMVLPIMRSRAKAVNFGIVYGIGAFSLAKDIGVSRAEADRYIKGYLATYPCVARYMDKVIEKAKLDGFVTTAFGRRRYLPELSSSNGMLRAFGERVARNAPIQGTAADIIKIAMIRVYERLEKELPSAKLILQVHDELIVECKEADADKACKILEEEMENAANLKVRLSVDANKGKNWLEAKG